MSPTEVSKTPSKRDRLGRRFTRMKAALSHAILWTVVLLTAQAAGTDGPVQASRESLWALRPLTSPAVPPAELGSPADGASVHPIDRFVARTRRKHGLCPLPEADRATLLRRVSLDLTGLPPTPVALRAFLADASPHAYERVVDRLLASPQHGPRYARHWLDVLRYTDVDGRRLAAEPSLFLWRDWVIDALNDDLPYDRFVAAQIAGDLPGVAQSPAATGFLARGARSPRGGHPLSFAAVETISTAFLGLTVGCAKCHDHMYDPISQRDFYAMKALFEPLKLEKTIRADASEIASHQERVDAYVEKKRTIQEPLDAFLAPFKKTIFEERLRTLPPDVVAAYRKPAAERTPAEEKITRDYGPIVRVDPDKLREIMTTDEVARYATYLDKLKTLVPPDDLPVLWSITEDPARAQQSGRILGTGDPNNPGEEVAPGFPLAPEGLDFAAGRRLTFLRWLTADENPLFVRVAVNRIWYWHFGRGLVESVSDFGSLSKPPSDPELLDWLASEFRRLDYSMKRLHRLIVTSATYRLASTGDSAVVEESERLDADNRYLWRHSLRRLEAEPIRDILLFAAAELDLAIGGRSFRSFPAQRTLGRRKLIGNFDTRQRRRTIYMGRGYYADRNLMPTFLTLFDAEDGRLPCSQREKSVSALQTLFFENGELVESVSRAVAKRLPQGDLRGATRLAYVLLLSREPTPEEETRALEYLGEDPARLPGLTWILINLDEFVFTR
jgi:hypothetical protein